MPEVSLGNQHSPLAELAQRLGPVDEAQIRLLLRVSPAQRIQTMLDMQAVILNSWQSRLRRSHPELTDLELCHLIFDRLRQNG
jgi:hypothetical protein